MVCRMSRRTLSRYELHCPPLREWPARGAANFRRLYGAAPVQWLAGALLLPGTAGRAAVRSLPQAALSREVNTI